jgi:PRC-barrel domain protein
MATIWVWRLYGRESGANMLPDITGYDVEATDGNIGKVDDATYENGEGALVVDTGFWIFGKKRVIPAGVIDRVDPQDQKIYLNLTKDQVKDAPDWDETRWRTDDYRHELGDYYQAS